ncbi:alpha/beta fold hydrolase [Microbacteriaceae bacterium 4G12]
MKIPWEKVMIQTSRGTFEVFVKGSGNPVCVTHHYSEFNETGDHFAESFVDDNKVFLVNLREAGNSSKAQKPYQLSMIEAVFDLEEIRKALGYTSWTFAGHSTGGMIGLLYGIHYSSSLESLIIVGSAAREYTSSSDCIYNEKHPDFHRMRELIELLKLSDLSPSDRKEISKERTKLSLYNPDKYDDYFSAHVHKKMATSRMDFFAREALTFDLTRQLPRISTKTLLLCGEFDVQCSLPFSIEMNELIPNSDLHIFELSNHYPFLEEQPLFKQVVKNFLVDSNEKMNRRK